MMKRSKKKASQVLLPSLLVILCILMLTVESSKVRIDGIEPNAGPISGNTRVLVRGGPFTNMKSKHPTPRCKFGRDDLIVEAEFVKCTPEPLKVNTHEAYTPEKTDTCIQCENAPIGFKAEIVPFTVSLTGDFTDIENSVPYRYYNDPKLWAIYPRYGLKDGGTRVEVWGENFLNFDQFTRCNFGSKSVQATFVNDNYMFCSSPYSDVTSKGIPFSVTLNMQQNTRDNIDFWYYNSPSVTKIKPWRGPDDGGTDILIVGNNFDPFRLEEISNHNDTFCEFIGLGLVKATVVNSTKLICTSPASYVKREAEIEVTLNNQQYTDDNITFHYYKPPYIFDLDPLQGPTTGNTSVTVRGTNFKDTKHIRCKFGDKETAGKYVSKHNVQCISPEVGEAGYVPLIVAFEDDLWSSSQNVKYLYYNEPKVSRIEPICGPTGGFTQITVFGENFIDLGNSKAQCVFNKTTFMSATIMEKDIIKCDSPNAFGWGAGADASDKFYNLEITLDGRLIKGPAQRFSYYQQTNINSIEPNMGPVTGGTLISMKGFGYKQKAVCNATTRFATYHQDPQSIPSDDTIIVKSPAVATPDSVVVAVALNGQQFTKDVILYDRDPTNTFTYYEHPYISDYEPETGLSGGNTLIKIKGKGFLPLKNRNGTYINTPVYVRMLEETTRKRIGNVSKAEYVDNENIHWNTPAAPANTRGIISVSLNKHEWYNIEKTDDDQHVYTYYESPKIEKLDPEYGQVRHKSGKSVKVLGSNFQCQDQACHDLKCRFGSPPDAVYVKGVYVSNQEIDCPLPNYPQPDVLDVEVTVNGVDYTNDKKKFGFFDPFVLRVSPRLISRSGNTKVKIHGVGFVDTKNSLKVKFDDPGDKTYCNGDPNQKCVVLGKFIDKNTIETPTLPINQLTEDGNEVTNELPINVEVTVLEDDFTDNQISVWYYDPPVFSALLNKGSPANEQSPILVDTDFKLQTNNLEELLDKGNFTCRFKSKRTDKVIYTPADAVTYPFVKGNDPTHVKCHSPIWELEKGDKEIVDVDVSSNGVDFSGGFEYTFTDNLEILRLSPLCGPVTGGTKVDILGQGFNTRDNVRVKWGVVNVAPLEKSSLLDQLNSDTPEAEMQKHPTSIAVVPAKLTPLVKDKMYNKVIMETPKLSNWFKTRGGPIYVDIGTNEHFDHVTGDQNQRLFSYTKSNAEFYYYKQPVVMNIYPHGGPIQGGTNIVVEGAWFDYKPEYDLKPRCKIGDHVSEGKYESTVRITCPAPKGTETDKNLVLQVSLNGQNYVDTEKQFHYYRESKLISLKPKSGPNQGGTTIRIQGDQFSNLSNSQEFKCRFKPLKKGIPPKFISARYYNKTTIMCASPGGWGSDVDAVNVDVTFNGVDYTDEHLQFSYYNIITAYPRSGPSDGQGKIHIKGQGFKKEHDVKCKIGVHEVKAEQVTWDDITCPIVPAPEPDYFGSVPLEVSVNGDEWQEFTGGFQYFPQPKVTEIFPKTGPNIGHGKIKFYVENFKADFQLSELGCKIGDAYGKATTTDDDGIMTCEINEIPLSGGNDTLAASMALNNVSWTPSNEKTYYTPYGVRSIFPNSGPEKGGTEVTVLGQGFINNGHARCRFGVPGDYSIVQGSVLSQDKMVCKTPQEFLIPPNAELPYSVPFSVAFNTDEYKPWTQSSHRFRFYRQPFTAKSVPEESRVGKVAEVYVYAQDGSKFIQPVPVEEMQYTDYGIYCKFGRFGQTAGTLINSTLVKCVTPTINEDPSNIYRETVPLEVAMNGQNFNKYESSCKYTFIGTGEEASFWPWILGLVLILLLLLGLLLCIAALMTKRAYQDDPDKYRQPMRNTNTPHVQNRRPRGTADEPSNVPRQSMFSRDAYYDDRYDSFTKSRRADPYSQ